MNPRYRCPQCGSLSLYVNAMLLVSVDQTCDELLATRVPSDTVVSTAKNVCHEWDDTHNMECLGCGYCAAAASFVTMYINFFPGKLRGPRELSVNPEASYGVYDIVELVDAVITGSTCSTPVDGVKAALEDGALWGGLCDKHGDDAVQAALEELHALLAKG